MTKKEGIKKTIVLIDSNALIHRAFHALPPLTKKDGTPSGAVYGYALTLLSVLDQLKPDYIAATFDLKGPTFRHEKYDQYKATRKKAPDELYAQIPIVKEMLRSFGIEIFEKAGFEADDVIGTLAKKGNLGIKEGLHKVIVTGDMDALQLVEENVEVFTLRKGIKDTVIYDTEGVKERYNLTPTQIIDYKSLCGDASDNIPGVKGIGAIGATKLLVEYGTLEGVYENIDKITAKAMKKKLEEGREDAFLSYDLATIRTDVKFDFDLAKCSTESLDKNGLANFFKEMEFFTLFKRMGGVGDLDENGTKEDKPLNKEELEVKVDVIENKEDLEKIIETIKKDKLVSISSLASEGRFHESSCQGLGLCVNGKKGYFVKTGLIDELKEVFLDESIKKIGYDFKKDIQILEKELEIELRGDFFDTQIAAYLLDASTKIELEKLVFKEFGVELENKVTKKGQASLLDDTEELKQKEAAEKAIWQMRLKGRQEEELEKVSKGQVLKEGASLMKVFTELEAPVIRVISEMENAGIKVKKQTLEDLSEFTQNELDRLEGQIYSYVKTEFNINSPSQLAVVLYDELEIPTKDIKKGKTGFSTAADQLAKIKELHPIVAFIEEYRELFKVKTTYADALPKLVEEDGRIHARFNQAVTATGRLSSSNPNLQNIPKHGKLANLIRSAFICEEGKVLISADYSQIDLRVAAHLSGDPKMIEIFQSGKDIHSSTAAWVNDIPQDEVTDKQRSEAKSLNFGILYGMGLYGFMRDSGVSRQRAKFFMDEYMKAFSKLKDFIEGVKELARSNGFVETELGRRRYIPAINSQNAMMRNAAERVTVNLPIQGLAADIMKLAMIATWEDVMKKYNKQKQKVRMVLQIHDELVFEVDEDITDEFEKDLKKSMESVYKLKVPLIVDVSRGKNWSEL